MTSRFRSLYITRLRHCDPENLNNVPAAAIKGWHATLPWLPSLGTEALEENYCCIQERGRAMVSYWRVSCGIHLWFVSQIFFFIICNTVHLVQRYLQVYGGKIPIL